MRPFLSRNRSTSSENVRWSCLMCDEDFNLLNVDRCVYYARSMCRR